MNITPITFCGKYYDFANKDPRKEYSGFRLGMPDKAVVELKNIGEYCYPVTAGMVREGYIKAYYPAYRNSMADSVVVGQDETSYGLRYDVTAASVRREILNEENAQVKREAAPYYVDFDNYRG